MSTAMNGHPPARLRRQQAERYGSRMSGELIAILAVGAAVLGVMLGALVPMLLAINGRLQSLGERVAWIEGRMAGGAIDDQRAPPQPTG